VPLALFDEFLDAFKEGGFIFFDPLVKDDFVVIKDEAGEFFAEIGGDTESGNSFGGAFLPGPEPDRIEVCVANQV
jgi:hypothetical protein